MERIKYIDSAKGILICMVVLIHVAYFYNSPSVGGTNDTFSLVRQICSHSYSPFCMVAFFLIHGYCSRKKRSFSESLEYGFRTLIVPMAFLIAGHKQWFCMALFGGILLQNILNHFSNRTKYVIYSLLMILGTALHKYGIERFYIPHILVFSPFLFLGERIHIVFENKKLEWAGALIYCLACLAYYLFNHSALPYISGSVFTVGYQELPVFVIVSICGSSAIILLAKYLQKSVLLNEFGKHSLVIFLFHFNIINFIEARCTSLLDNQGTLISLLAIILIFLASLFGSYLVSLLIHRHVPWLIGEDIKN